MTTQISRAYIEACELHNWQISLEGAAEYERQVKSGLRALWAARGPVYPADWRI